MWINVWYDCGFNLDDYENVFVFVWTDLRCMHIPEYSGASNRPWFCHRQCRSAVKDKMERRKISAVLENGIYLFKWLLKWKIWGVQ